MLATTRAIDGISNRRRKGCDANKFKKVSVSQATLEIAQAVKANARLIAFQLGFKVLNFQGLLILRRN